MKKEEYFGTYKESNAKKLSNYIEKIDESVEKYKNYGKPFLKGKYDYEYAKILEKKELNKKSMTAE